MVLGGLDISPGWTLPASLGWMVVQGGEKGVGTCQSPRGSQALHPVRNAAEHCRSCRSGGSGLAG